MKPKKKLLISCFLLSFCLQLNAQDSAKVLRVKDGDTYVLGTGARIFTVRLKNVDAPESKQNGGIEAKRFVDSLILNKTVKYFGTGIDRYGRVIVNININDKRLDSLIIGAGLGWQYITYNKELMLKNLMQEDIARKAGLWACGTKNVCPPWIWRQYNYTYKLRFCSGCNIAF